MTDSMQRARQIMRRMDESIINQLCKLVCYDEDYINGLAAFTGRSPKEALEMLQKTRRTK